MANYTKTYNPYNNAIPQTEKIPGTNQKINNAGGYSYVITPMQRLERFVVLGSEAGTYYTEARKLTKDNCKNLIELFNGSEAVSAVEKVVEISNAGRAPKNSPAIYALALAAACGNQFAKKAAFDNLNKVARTSTDFFAFITQYKELGGGFGAVAKRGLQNWYTSKDLDNIAYQMVKYRQRDGMTHHDVLHLAHVKPSSIEESNLYAFAKSLDDSNAKYDLKLIPGIVEGFLKAQSAKNENELVRYIDTYNLPREAIPTEFLNSPKVWEALLPHMGATALLRNLAKMTSINLISIASDAEKLVCDKLNDSNWLRKSRLHPISIFAAHKVYCSGRGIRGNLSWKPSAKIVEALNSAFYGAFKNVTPTGKKINLALDISGSMWGGRVSGFEYLNAAEVCGAMALVMANVEPNLFITAFTSQYEPLNIHGKMTLEQVNSTMHNVSARMGSTDCAVPMKWALENKKKFDSFVIMTDNETYFGRNGHPSQALSAYRKQMNNQASLVVCATSATEFSIADPNDAKSMDICGFDAAVPELITDFIRS